MTIENVTHKQTKLINQIETVKQTLIEKSCDKLFPVCYNASGKQLVLSEFQ